MTPRFAQMARFGLQQELGKKVSHRRLRCEHDNIIFFSHESKKADSSPAKAKVLPLGCMRVLKMKCL